MDDIFLTLLKDARLNQKSIPQPLDYIKLYQLAKEHQVVPMIYNQIYAFPDFDGDIKNAWKKEALRMNVIQTMKTERFLRLYNHFLSENLKVVVVKGLICRELYPQPDNRTSNDEDLYVEKKDYEKAKDVLIKEGFNVVEESEDVTAFIDPTSGVSIELHTELFSKSSRAYGNYQAYYENAFDHLTVHNIHGVDVFSLSHDLHLLFLMMHFVKHFLHGGVGFRQIMDIVMYSETFGKEIHWQKLYDILADLNTLTLMENVFALSQDYFAFDVSKIQLPNDYQKEACDYQDLLLDIMDAGIFGKSSAERLHSSTMTLNATATGKKSVLKSAFPKASDLTNRYPYLKKHPYLVPIAWANRIYHYLTNKQDGNAQKTIEMGNQRIELLKKYKVIQ